MRNTLATIATIALLCLNSQSSNAQNYIGGSTTQYPYGQAGGVNNEFGAGESGTVLPSTNPPPYAVRPYNLTTTNNALNNGNTADNPPAITVGSLSDPSQNIVINSYNANGTAKGWFYSRTLTFTYTYDFSRTPTRTLHGGNYSNNQCYYSGSYDSYYNSSTNSTTYYYHCSCTATSADSWSQGWSGPSNGRYDTNPFSVTVTPLNGVSPTTASVNTSETIWGGVGAGDPHVSDNGQLSPGRGTYTIGTNVPYVAGSTSTSDSDDGILLVQKNGAMVNSDPTYTTSTANANLPKILNGSGDRYLQPYVRPTSVAVAGDVSLPAFTFNDLQWWYKTFTVQKAPNTTITGTRQYSFGGWSGYTDHNRPGDLSGDESYDPATWYEETISNSNGLSGYLTCSTTQYYSSQSFTRTYQVTGTRYEDHTMTWNVSAALPGSYVNSSIQLLGGSRVCLTGAGVTKTTTANNTQPFVVYPATNNFVFRVNGNYADVHIRQDENATGVVKHYLNSELVDDNNANVYLGASGNTITGVINFSVAYDNILTPSASTTSSVHGVQGNYNNANDIIHTSASTTATNTPGVIEVGTASAGTGVDNRGFNRYYIHSGGTVKNWTGTCEPLVASAPLYFANANSDQATSGTPKFVFDGTATLNVLNDGTGNDASITFGNQASVNELTNGILNATGNGDLLVRAHGHVELDGRANFVTAGANGNNVSILSDQGSIKIGGTTPGGYTGYTTTSTGGDKGHVTVWAKGSQNSGYVDITGGWNSSAVNMTTSNYLPLYSSGTHALWDNNYACLPQLSSKTALTSNVQTRLQSDNDIITITGDFNHHGNAGALLVQAGGKIVVTGKTTIQQDGPGDVAFVSRDAIEFRNGFEFTPPSNTSVISNLYLDAPNGVDMIPPTATQDSYRGIILIKGNGTNTTPITSQGAHFGIRAGTINFWQNIEFDHQADYGNTEIWACLDINIHRDFLFKETSTYTHEDFRAGHNINVISTSPNTKFTTNTGNVEIDWTANNSIHTDTKITFERTTTGSTNNTDWKAGDSIVTTQNVLFSSLGQGNTTWEAGKQIFTGTPITGAVNGQGVGRVDFYNNNMAASPNVTWRATGENASGAAVVGTGSITTNAHVYFHNQTGGGSTEWLAQGTNSGGTGYGGKIITNDSVTFINLSNTGHTLWQANNLIQTNDTVKFYNSANRTNTTDPNVTYTRWTAANSIETDRPVTFINDGNSPTDWTAGTFITTGYTFNTPDSAVTGANPYGRVEFINQHAGGTTEYAHTNWTAGTDITTIGHVNFLNTTLAANTTWTAQNGNITAHDSVTFTNHSIGGYTLWDANKSSTGSTTEGNITTNDTVGFFYWDQNPYGYTEWEAATSIFTDYPVTFINKGTGKTDWEAQTGSITTGYQLAGTTTIDLVGLNPVTGSNPLGRVEFLNLNSTDNVTTAHTTWKAYANIVTKGHINFFDTTQASNTTWEATTGSIITNDSVTFRNRTDNGFTLWNAPGAAGNIITNDTVGFFYRTSPTSTDNGYTKWNAGVDIKTDYPVTFINVGKGLTDWRANSGSITTGYHTGGSSTANPGTDPVTGSNPKGRVEFLNLNATDETPAHTTWWAHNDIITKGHINFYNTTDKGHTTWDAGQGIHTRDSVTFTKNSKEGNTDWFARATNIVTDDTVKFYKTSVTEGHTSWTAQQNVKTDYPVTFINEGTGPTTWTATTADIITGYETGGNNNNVTTGAIPVDGSNPKGRVEFLNLNGAGGTQAHTTWTATQGSIITKAHINFLDTTDASNTKWYAGSSITTNDSVTFTNKTNTGATDWEANTGSITTNDTVGFFYWNKADGYTKWYAGQHINTDRPVTFINKGTGKTDWEAHGSITTAYQSGSISNDANLIGRVEFLNLNDTTTTAHTKWWAGENITTNAHVNFYDATNASNTDWIAVVNITTNDSVTFNNKTEIGHTLWQAGTNGNITTNDTIGFFYWNHLPGYTKWQAGSNIFTDYPVTFINRGSGTTDWVANTGDIVTGYKEGVNDSYPSKSNTYPVTGENHIGRVEFLNLTDTATAAHTTWTAQNNIITYAHANFLNNTTGSNTKWLAKTQDINTNDSVTFVNNSVTGNTEWEATIGTIYTTDTVGFHNTDTTTGHTSWYAGTDVWTEKPVTFLNEGKGYTSWRANGGDIITGHGNNNSGYVGRVEFLNLDTTANNAYTYWTAYHDIITNAHVNFLNNTKKAATNSSHTYWTAGNDITTNDSVTFTNTTAADTKWEAGQNITTNDTTFFNNSGIGNTTWWAKDGNITTNKGDNHSPIDYNNRGFVTFNNSGATGSNTEWHAGQNIFTNNVVTFNNEPETVTSAYIKWRAEHNNIQLEDSTIFNQMGAASHATLRTTGADNSSGGAHPGSLWLHADDSIYTEKGVPTHIGYSGVHNNEDPLLINFGPLNNAPIMLHAFHGDIKTQGVIHIDRQNLNQSETTLEAGHDIHFLDTLTLLDLSQADILLHADSDILVNCDICDPHNTAPVDFTVTNSAATRWVAGRNLHTKDFINFNYNSTANKVLKLNLVAMTGNVKTDRAVRINYDGNSQILFSATNNVPPIYSNTGGNATPPELRYATDEQNLDDGNIFLNDSVIIIRTNPTVGNTDIVAKNNIRTAALYYLDQRSQANNSLIESRLGDIFLGYSMKPDDCPNPRTNTSYSYDKNVFTYHTISTQHNGKLEIKSGFGDVADEKTGGGNVYFTHIDFASAINANSGMEITIPFATEFMCDQEGYMDGARDDVNSAARLHYEHNGIIGGIPCGWNVSDWVKGRYANVMVNADPSGTSDPVLKYKGNNGDLKLDAGTRGNILINRGAELNFRQNTGDAVFITRFGNIDFRNKFDVDSMAGSLLLLASSDRPEKLQTGQCTCEEQRNNVYLQDFHYTPHVNSGSVFMGADNNIKVQYGGLKTVAGFRSPFFSPNGDQGYPCGANPKAFHCDSDPNVNQARNLSFNFRNEPNGKPITSGGVAMVASDLIDIYKPFQYVGGTGSGLSTVPGYGTLHGESVAGYGLYIKTQANKNNWSTTPFDASGEVDTAIVCHSDTGCDHNSVLHDVARVTFHADAQIVAENQRVIIASPVLETFGPLDLNTFRNGSTNNSISVRTDSLILHDSLIVEGPRTGLQAWSNLKRNMPIVKLGHHRRTPPYTDIDGDPSEDNTFLCKSCYVHPNDPQPNGGLTPLDTIHITYRNGGNLPRLNSLVLDHAVISFLTDSFDRTLGYPTTDAKIFSDMVKVRNHVELYTDPDRTRTGHFELVSEPQMSSKDFAGIYTRHLHMEPEAPACSRFHYSQLWTGSPTLEVITTSVFGGYGWIHADVYVEIDATIAPGWTSLKGHATCVEHGPGILKMNDLRMDRGAQIEFSIGDNQGTFTEEETGVNGNVYQLGEFADLIDVDSMTLRGELVINLKIRPEGLHLSPGDARCFPIIKYQKVGANDLRNIKLAQNSFTSDDHPDIKSTYRLSLSVDTAAKVVSVCVTTDIVTPLMNSIFIPDVDGVQHYRPEYGIHWATIHNAFAFALTFDTDEPLQVVTNRVIAGIPEGEIYGNKNQNGEYEYLLRNIMQDVIITIGPGFASTPSNNPGTGIADINSPNVWAHKNTLYIKANKDDIASVYTVTGQLVKKIELEEGNTATTLVRGVYIVTLKNGTVHKIIIQ